MQVSFTSTQVNALVIGATETFGALGIVLITPANPNGAPWNLNGGTASITLADPYGTPITLAGTISSDTVTVAWTVAGNPGDWSRYWTFTDDTGLTQVTIVYPFQVVGT